MCVILEHASINPYSIVLTVPVTKEQCISLNLYFFELQTVHQTRFGLSGTLENPMQAGTHPNIFRLFSGPQRKLTQIILSR